MKGWDLARRAFAVCATGVLVACGGEPAQPGLPASRSSQTLPAAVGRSLIYAGGDETSYVFTFPGGKLVRSLGATSFGTCSDRNGDVFFTQVKSVVEYAHGGTAPIATFAVPGTAYSCSVDPTTGDLATVVFCISQCSGDEVLVLRAPGAPPKTYHDSTLKSLLYCAYDGDGDLFVDGYNGTQFGLTELAKGANAFERIALKPPIKAAGQIQWDGKDLAIETLLDPVIFRVAISGSTASIVGRTHLNGVGSRATQSWIQGETIAVPTGPNSKRAIEILFWNYPAGGNPIGIVKGFIGGGHQMIDGVTVSLAPKT